MLRDALVIGINTYQHLPGLQAPARDAEAIAHQLQTYGEFRVHRLPEVIQSGQPQIGQKTPVTLRELETALVNLFKPKGNNIPHTALFYFSGHGMQKEVGIQEGYLALSDSNPEAGLYGLSLFWLRRLLQESPVRQRVVLLDCCHSGELLNFLEADPGARPGTDRLFMAASREYESAYESLNSPYSVFTQALVAGLEPQRLETGIVTNHSLVACVSESLKAEIQQPLFESSGSEIILTRSTGTPAPTQNVLDVLTDNVCPYRGLECFDEDHADYFYGREDLTHQLVNKLKESRFAAVVGASGSGKSSLVRAGLIKELRQKQRQGSLSSEANSWRIKLITPSEHPLKSLASAFVDLEATDLERAEQLRRAEMFLREGDNGLAQLAHASLLTSNRTQLQQRPRLLLVIDQFEEVFTLCQGSQAEVERRQFLNCLTKALETAGDSLSILIVLRADFFEKCSPYGDLSQQIESNLVLVTPLSYEQIKATITRPAQKVGLICEPNLVYTMLLDVIGAPGELPLLQHALLELWNHRQTDPSGKTRLTLDAYTALGGVRGTLQKRATEIFDQLTPEEQVVAKRIFLALTQLGEGTEDTRRRISKSELVSPSFPIALVEQTLEKLVAAKLVIISQIKEGFQAGQPKSEGLQQWELTPLLSRGQNDVGSLSQIFPIECQETIDVVHEALIRNWSLLRQWLDENREMLRRQRRIEQAAQEWDWAGQVIGVEYLLQGSRLADAQDFLSTYPRELSAVAQQYIVVSQQNSDRASWERQQRKIAVPSVMLIALLTIVKLAVSQSFDSAMSYGGQEVRSQTTRSPVAETAPSPSISPHRLAMATLVFNRLSFAHQPEIAQSGLNQALQQFNSSLQSENIVKAIDPANPATVLPESSSYLWALRTEIPKTHELRSSERCPAQ
jgi:energy-coupling factor transporter ATP-binding protein EcfA2